jgi:lysyl endopeptidase
MLKTMKNWLRGVAASALAAALLTACGGGSDTGASAPVASSGATTAQTQVLKVEPREQPATAVQNIVRTKLRSQSAADQIQPTRIALGPLLQSKAAAAPEQGSFVPMQIGTARAVAATASSSALQRELQWRPSAAGGLVAAISVSAEGAHGLRLGLLVTQLPGSAMLRVYSQFRPTVVQEISGQEVLQLIDRNQRAGDTSDAARTWWTPDTGDSEATLEIELPPGTPASALQVAIPQISHVFVDLSVPQDGGLGTQAVNDSSSCELDAVCYSESNSMRNAVARMIFVQNGGSYLCTGTLLNDTGSSGTPYFLTANHCISSQTVASTLQTDWFFRAPSCNSRTLASNTQRRTGGATLLYATSATDTSFLQLNDTPPAGAVFAGWSANPGALNSSAIGVHHPKGDLLKISFGQLNTTLNCQSTGGTGFSCSTASGTQGSYYGVSWTQGLTEGGSSGSGLFQGNYLVGTLYGGTSSSSCSVSTLSVYGRFDLAYQAAISLWLAPPGPISTPRAAVYRFYNQVSRAHFFTASSQERDYVISTLPSFNYEGVAFYVYSSPTVGQTPVFRFYNGNTGAHFYTISQSERDSVVANLPVFQYEGVRWYAQTFSGNASIPIYRFYNQKTGAHFYTVSASERDFVIANYAEFKYEGIAYNAWSSSL